MVRAKSAWWVGTGSLDFSYTSLSKAGADASAWVELTGSVGGVNIAAAAAAVSVVSVFGLRTGQRRWAWWFLAFCLIWVGLHDAATAMSRPVEDCEGCPALARIRSLGLDDPSAGRPGLHCNFGDRRIRAAAAGKPALELLVATGITGNVGCSGHSSFASECNTVYNEKSGCCDVR